MPYPLFRAVAVAALLASAAAPAAATGPGWHAPARTGLPGARLPGSAPGVLTLITGERVLAVSAPGGPRLVSVLGAPGYGPTAAVAAVRMGGRYFVIPAQAMPYLGRDLDLSLFDLALLRHAERGGRLLLTLRYRGRPRVIPGITVTRAAAGMADGYITHASAATFAAALARQLASDHARGSYGNRGLFAGHLSIGLTGSSPAGGRADEALHTVTVTGTNLAGKPDTGDSVLVDNIDDSGAAGTGIESFQNGTATFAVGSGTYWAAGMFAQFSRRGRITAVRMDVLPQFTVSANTTVRTAAAAASSKVTMVTPRPAISRTPTFTVLRPGPRPSASGPSGLRLQALNIPLWVSPVSRPPSHGRLQAYTQAQLTSPAGTAVPYAYTLNFVNPPGIIPPQRFTARPGDLATVVSRYFQDVRSAGAWLTEGGTPNEVSVAGFGGLFIPLRLPGRQVEYLSAKPAMLWQSLYLQYQTTFPGQPEGGQTAGFRLFRPGQHLNQAWGAYPLHPASNVVFPGSLLMRSSATRAGNTLSLDLTPFSDNQTGHTGTGLAVLPPAAHDDVTGTFALYQNGKKIAGGNAVNSTSGFGDLQVSAVLSPKPSVIRFVVTASRASTHYRLSATSRDVYTWHTRPRLAATIPAPWLCNFAPGPVSADRHCAVQPMMTLDYNVVGMAANGTTKPGNQAITITVGHIQPAAPSPIASTRVQVSFDHGKTWHPARVTRLPSGRFRAVFTAPPNSAITLRTNATDTARGSITETITSAYRTGP